MPVRLARPDDLPRLRDVEVAAGARFGEIGMPEVADDPPPGVDELRGAARLVVAVDDSDEHVGYARVDVVDGHAHLEQLSVHPDHGGRGLGTELLDAVARWADARGDRELTLTTFREVPFNAPFYARRGYAVIADGERGPELVARMEAEAAHGLDPALRVAMRRPLARAAHE